MPTRLAAVAAILIFACALGFAQGPQKPNVVKGLELSEPQLKTKPGVAKVTAKVAAGKDAKVQVVFDVEATFEDADVEFDWEVRDGGQSVQVTIPDSKGTIRVSAVAIVDGVPTDVRMAKTYVTVDYKPRDKASPAPPPAPPVAPPATDAPPDPKAELPKAELPMMQPKKDQVPPKPVAKGKVAEVYFVIDVDKGDPEINALLSSQRIRNKLRDAGVKAYLFGTDSDSVAKNGLTKYVADAGGSPCAVYVTEDRKVRKAVKVAKGTKLEDILAEAAKE